VFLDVPPHFGDMGLPLVPDVLPLRRHLFAVTVGLVLEPIGCRGGLFSCAAASAASLSLVLSPAARSVSVAVFALSEIFSNCALKSLSAIEHSSIN
jgi:hypothetical protein